jgi:hypothetical protein
VLSGVGVVCSCARVVIVVCILRVSHAECSGGSCVSSLAWCICCRTPAAALAHVLRFSMARQRHTSVHLWLFGACKAPESVFPDFQLVDCMVLVRKVQHSRRLINLVMHACHSRLVVSISRVVLLLFGIFHYSTMSFNLQAGATDNTPWCVILCCVLVGCSAAAALPMQQ